jgi:hypothetical protein
MHRDRPNSGPLWKFALGVRASHDAGEVSPRAVLRQSCGLLALAALAVLTAHGCNAWQPATYNPPVLFGGDPPIMSQGNPLIINNMDPDLVWDQTVDVVDDYFRVEHEERVRVVGEILTEGFLETYPRGASTIFEPWNQDSVTPYQRWHATLQSMRRRAKVYVIPVEGGFQVDVQVYKELEDVARPESGSISLANSQTLRNDDALQRLTNPVGGQEPTRGWIGIGRDAELEQVILSGIQARTGGTFVPAPHEVGMPAEDLPAMPAEVLPAMPESLPPTGGEF